MHLTYSTAFVSPMKLNMNSFQDQDLCYIYISLITIENRMHRSSVLFKLVIGKKMFMRNAWTQKHTCL